MLGPGPLCGQSALERSVDPPGRHSLRYAAANSSAAAERTLHLHVVSKRLLLACSSFAVAAVVGAQTPQEQGPRLADAPQLEQQTLERMLEGGSWARRALGAMRLERFVCPHSQAMLTKLLDDPD